MKQLESETRERIRGGRGVLGSEVLLAAYLAVAVTLTILHGRFGAPGVGALASSPHSVAAGGWWLLLTSGFFFAGIVLPQVILVVVLGVALLRLCGALVFWLTVSVGHIVCTALVYLGVWAIGLFDSAGVASLSRRPDYGVSLVWCACIGAVTLAVWLRSPRQRHGLWLLLPAVAVAFLVVIVIFSDPLSRYEHLLAFLSGVLVVLLVERRPWPLRKGRRPLCD